MRCPRARAQELMKLATAAVIDYGRKLPEAVCAPLHKKYSQLSGLLACVPAACTAHALCVLYFIYLYLWIPCCCANTPRRGRTATEISAAVGLPGIGYIEDDLHVTLGVWAVVYTMHGADPPTEVTHPKAPKPTSQLREVRASVACVLGLVWFPSVVDCGLG